MQKIKNFVRNILYKIVSPPVLFNSYSDAGEDIIASFLFNGVGNHKPTYLELGSSHPTIGNNTYLFYLRGATGVLVEADKTLIPILQKVRPQDKILNIGVGTTKQKEAPFFIFDLQRLNTFSAEEAHAREKHGTFKITSVVKIPLKSINEIIAENFKTFPDFLSIDIEGLDFPVLQTLDFEKYPIPVICAETCTYSENHIKPKDKSIEEFMRTKAYFVYADTYINTIFVKKEWFNAVRLKR